jgi:hypothetical protein
MSKVERVRRTPMGARNVLNVAGKDSNYEYRVVNDVGDRVAEMQERGYEIDSDNKIKVGDRRVANPTASGTPNQVSVGGGTKAFVMRIKKEWYDDDQKEKMKQVDATEQTIRSEASQNGLYGKVELSRD